MELLIRKLVDIVGDGNFHEAPEILETYSRDHSFVPPRKPLAVIKPKTQDEIKKVVDFANETSIPLIPTSSGFPKFHGDTIPSCPGIVVDLSSLNQVLRVDRRNRVAIIDPGVTFGKLRTSLKENGMVPYTPLLPRSTKSVLASYLEREPITIPKDHWNFNDPIAAGQVIIGDGHVQGFGDTASYTKQEVITGDVIPVSPEGPSSIGWLTMIQGAQGTLGIVPWVGVRCRIKPSIEKPFFVSAQDLKDLIPFLQKIMQPRIIEELLILNSFGLASILLEEQREIKKLQANLPTWVVFLNIAGYERYPEEKVQWKEEQVREIAVWGDVELKEAVGPASAFGLLKILEETASKDRRLRCKTSCQVLPFETILGRTPDLTTLAAKTAGDFGYPSADMSIYIQPIIQGSQCYCEICYPYNVEDPGEVEIVRNLFATSAQRMKEIGAYYSRPYGMLSDITYKDTEVVNVLRKIKNILDPNDIMNSGKLY